MKKLYLIIALSLSSLMTFAQTNWEEYYRNFDGIPKMTAEDEALLKAQRYPASLKRDALPARVDNTSTPYFRPIFSQADGSCAQASGIGYCFTYEMNAARGLKANLADNEYPTHFSYNFLCGGVNNGSHTYDGFKIARDLGIPSVSVYGGMNPIGYTGWMTGYSKYYSAMQNRLSNYYYFGQTSVAEIETLKRWMYNHDGKKSYGGLVVFYTTITGADIETIPTGQYGAGNGIWLAAGSTGGHAMTLAGYDDNIGWDWNGDGQITNDVDINGDGVINVKDYEKGAFILVNSWGSGWWNNGRVYCPYKAVAQGAINTIIGIDVTPTYTPKLTLRVVMTCNNRSNINILSGCTQDVTASTPTYTRMYAGFANQYSGALPMQGTSTDPIEFGLDVSDLLAKTDPTKDSKFFFRVDAGTSATGTVSEVGLISYEVNEDGTEYLSSQKNVSLLTGGQTLISIIRPALPLNPPENLLAQAIGTSVYLTWSPPVEGCLVVSGYKIYKNGTLLSKVAVSSDLNFTDNADNALSSSYQISALYTENGKEFESNLTTAVTVPTEVSPSAITVNFVADVTSIDQGNVVHFTDKTTGNPIDWFWTIESTSGNVDPQYFSNQNPTVTFKKSGTYTISLSAGNSVDRSSTFKYAYITVNSIVPPVADFTANVTTINETGGVVYTDLSTKNPMGYTWHFQGGTPEYSHLSNPKITYNKSGVFETTLTVTNAEGSNSITKTNYITVKTVTPVADFTSDAISILKGSSIKYQDLTKYTPTSWKWTFGGGTPATSTVQNPTVRYPKAGMYNVTVETSNAVGSSSKTVQRYAQVSAIDGGNSLAFDGVDDCVSVTGLFATAPTQFTVEFWLKPTSMSDYNQKIGVGWGTFLFHCSASGTVSTGVSWETANRIDVANAIDLNRWQHFAITYNNRAMVFYKNGEIIGSKTVTASSGAWNGFNIGTTDVGTINGKVDEVRVWNVARTQTQIKSLINSEIADPSAENNLILYYKFNQSGSATVEDAKGTYTGKRLGYSVVGDAWGESMAFCANGDVSLPIANFDMNTNIVYKNVPVQFTDKSSDNPISFSWTFSGANDILSVDANPSITFANTGEQTVQLDVVCDNTLTATKTVTFTILEDTELPSVPQNLGIVNVGSTSISLSWSPSTDNVAVKGYRIYLDGVKVQETENCSITLANLSTSKTYKYTVSAFDAAGNESAVASWDAITTLTSVNETSNNLKTNIYSSKNTVCVDLKVASAEVEIFNLLGQKVVKTYVFNGLNKIPMKDNGIFIVRVKSKQSCEIQKLFVK